MSRANRLPLENPLTERELEILQLVCAGLTNHEIAAKLHLTHGTVKWYASQIYSKLGVSNRTQATTKAYELGLIPDPSKQPKPEKILRIAEQPRKYEQRIYFTNSFDGTQIAYAISGEGPPLVEAAHHFSHLEYEWESPVYRHLLREFMRKHRLIRYDERGSGLSQWDIEGMSFEAWMKDLEAVIEAAGAGRFVLFGKSKAGTIATAYAAQHPEKVSHLVLLGTYALGSSHRALSPEDQEEYELMVSLIKLGWEHKNPAFRQTIAACEFPDGPPDLIAEMEKLIEETSTAQNALNNVYTMRETDITDLARQIKVPTLIFHAIDDQVVPFKEGQYLASLIPGAEFVPLDTMNHLLVEGEPAWHKFQKHLRRFLQA